MSSQSIRLASEAYYGLTFIAEGAAVSLLKSKLYGAGLAVKSAGVIIDEQTIATNKSSIYGTPVMSNIIFGDPLKSTFTYTDFDGNPTTINTVKIDCALLTISSQKNIVETIIEGRDDTVKQFISNGSTKIDLTIIIATQDNSYPKDIVLDLNTVCDIPDSVPVTSDLLNLLGINSVVIKEKSIPQEEGFYNQQKFTISMLSDIPIDLQSVSS